MWGFWLKVGKPWELSFSPCNNKEIFKILLHIVNAVWAAGSGNGPFLMPFAKHYQCEINPQVVYEKEEKKKKWQFVFPNCENMEDTLILVKVTENHFLVFTI